MWQKMLQSGGDKKECVQGTGKLPKVGGYNTTIVCGFKPTTVLMAMTNKTSENSIGNSLFKDGKNTSYDCYNGNMYVGNRYPIVPNENGFNISNLWGESAYNIPFNYIAIKE